MTLVRPATDVEILINLSWLPPEDGSELEVNGARPLPVSPLQGTGFRIRYLALAYGEPHKHTLPCPHPTLPGTSFQPSYIVCCLPPSGDLCFSANPSPLSVGVKLKAQPLSPAPPAPVQRNLFCQTPPFKLRGVFLEQLPKPLQIT